MFSKGIMVWGGIGYNGSTNIYIPKQTIHSAHYQKILTDAYLPIHNEAYILMRDNSRPNISALTKSFFGDNGISLFN